MIKSVFAAVALASLAATAVSAAPLAAAFVQEAPLPTINSPIKDLLANPKTAAVVEKHLPGVSQHPALPQFQDMTLPALVPISGGAVTQATVDAIDTDLKALAAS